MSAEPTTAERSPTWLADAIREQIVQAERRGYERGAERIRDLEQNLAIKQAVIDGLGERLLEMDEEVAAAKVLSPGAVRNTELKTEVERLRKLCDDIENHLKGKIAPR